MTISEVSKKYDISVDTLRYYERIGLLQDVARNKSGIRDYSEENTKWVVFLKCMRNAGVSIEALIEYVKLFHQGNETIEARENILIEQRDILLDKLSLMEETLKKLDYKIDLYKTGKMVKYEKELKKEKK